MEFGIDLSHWNGAVGDLSSIVKFVIHKATEGATVQDEKYTHNRVRCENALWLAYHVFRGSSTVRNQFNNFKMFANLKQGERAVVDLEHKHAKSMAKEFGYGRAVSRLLNLGNMIQKDMHTRPILYASLRSLRTLVGSMNFEKVAAVFDLWVVKHAGSDVLDVERDQVANWWPGHTVLWQYTSKGDGNILGVPDEDIDYNVCLDWDLLVRGEKQRAWTEDEIKSAFMDFMAHNEQWPTWDEFAEALREAL